MKRIVLIAVVAMLMAVPLTASAGSLWGMVKNAGVPIKESNSFVIEVSGVNIRGYVFDVPEIQSRCLSVWGDNTQQLECKTYAEIIESEKAVEEKNKK